MLLLVKYKPGVYKSSTQFLPYQIRYIIKAMSEGYYFVSWVTEEWNTARDDPFDIPTVPAETSEAQPDTLLTQVTSSELDASPLVDETL